MKFLQTFILLIFICLSANTISGSVINSMINIENSANIMQTENPKEFHLYQNFPNPFNPSTIITYSIPEEAEVTLKVFDILGNQIAVLVDRNHSKGTYEVEFDSESIGKGLTSGIYLYQLKSKDFIQTKKFILSK
jgi:hypothetical protein